ALTPLRLGRALRQEGRALDDLAVAGLLHAVGHLEPAARGESPARRRELHPVRGAARLAALDGVPDVAVVVAQDHHLRFDRAPSYPATPAPRSPAVAARVVAVADTWETIRARPGIRPEEMVSLLRSRAGTFLDPALVELLVATPGIACYETSPCPKP
ncbi:MAG TPA: HD domain-containing protein, partial [Anaeromyxobacteraceae bacterium]|nr:HD domain-containing protein [Anaeromyxobacteraceae bacterium]